jgi:hypothetical protein
MSTENDTGATFDACSEGLEPSRGEPVPTQLHRDAESVPQITREDQRRIERYLIEQRLAPRPMDSRLLGKMRVDASGRSYVNHHGGLHRAHVDGDGNVRIVTKWGKARRKAEKRRRRQS